MKGELKAGGMALVIKSTEAEDVGKVVRLVQLIQPGEYFTAPNGDYCRNRPENQPVWSVLGDVICKGSSAYVAAGWAMFPPARLMPIDDSDPDTVDELSKDKPVEVTA